MAKQLQLRRGTTAENDAFTGAIGEVTVDTTLKQLRVHDGETQGGIKVANAADVVADLATKQDTSNLVTAVSSASTDTQYPSAKLLYDALAAKADVSALANKADKATTLAGYGITDAVAKGHEVIEFQKPTAQNNYTWYRKYADGWVEQGGVVDKGSDVRDLSSTVNLSVEMANNFYSISVIGRAEGGGPSSMCTGAKSQLSTSFFAYCFGLENADTARYMIWRVEGTGA